MPPKASSSSSRAAGACRLAENTPPCPLCRKATTARVLHVERVPALCNVFWPTEEAARAAPRGDIDLRFCDACGLLHNAAFDQQLVLYSPEYENSIHFSPVFQGYIDELARRLVDRYDLHGKDIVEIGCGNGDFLTSLCLLGDNRGVGYDPSHDPARAPASDGRVRISADPYPDEGVTADLVSSRHVLEHLPDPGSLVSSVRTSLGDRRGGIVYFEVPDATYMLEEAAIWDLIHEHCSYFSAPTLFWLFGRAGFEIIEVGRSLGDQYLWIEARPGPLPAGGPPLPDITALEKLLADFADTFTSTVEGWKERVAGLDSDRVAVWGAGAKGVMFLNLVDPEGRIRHVVDINPHKHGRHVPGTGQRIVGPADLAGDPPEHVIVMNPLFAEEVRATLAGVGVRADVLAV